MTMAQNFCRTPWKLTPDAIVDADGNPLISRGDNPQDDLICETIVANANEIAGLRINLAKNKGDLERAKFIATVDRKAMEAHEAAIAEWRRRAEKAEAALSGSPQVEAGTWRDDPTSDERWNAGCDFAMAQLCNVLKVDPANVNWDAATETIAGDVRSVIGNILENGLGENWQDRSFRPREQEGGEYELHCVHGHDLCYQGTDENCPYCEKRPIAHPAPLPADGWNYDMAAAPRDGTRIIIAVPDIDNIWEVCEARYIKGWWHDIGGDPQASPTAWCRLPTPPASTEGV